MVENATEPTVQTDEDREALEEDRRRFVAQKLQQENSIRCSQLVGLTCQRLLKSASDVDPCVLATASLVATQSLYNVAKTVPLIFPARPPSRGRPGKIILELVDAVAPSRCQEPQDEVSGAAIVGESVDSDNETRDETLPATTADFDPHRTAAVDLIAGFIEDDDSEE